MFDERDLAFPKWGRGRCINCGFLSKVSRSPGSEQIWEAEVLDRSEGKLYRADEIETWPRCFRWIAIFAVELGDDMVMENEASTHKAITKDRGVDGQGCPGWVQWITGFGPHWHMEQLIMLQLEEMRRANDLKIAELQQQSQKTLAEIAVAQREVSADHLEFVRISNRQVRNYNIAFLLLAFVAAVLAIGALAYPNGATWLDWMPGQHATQGQQSGSDTVEPP